MLNIMAFYCLVPKNILSLQRNVSWFKLTPTSKGVARGESWSARAPPENVRLAINVSWNLTNLEAILGACLPTTHPKMQVDVTNLMGTLFDTV